MFVHTELSNPGQRRDALRLLCLLLPQANRDTLQELLTFLSRVALHSDGIILIDVTEVSELGHGVECCWPTDTATSVAGKLEVHRMSDIRNNTWCSNAIRQ